MSFVRKYRKNTPSDLTVLSNDAQIARDEEEAKKLLSELSIKSVRALSRLLDSADERTVFNVASLVLDRVFGKPSQNITSDVKGSVTLDLALEREVRTVLLSQASEVIDIEPRAKAIAEVSERAGGGEGTGSEGAYTGADEASIGGSQEPSEVSGGVLPRRRGRKPRKVSSLVEQYFA